MAYRDHEVFETHCRKCLKQIEADSIEELLEKVTAHEALDHVLVEKDDGSLESQAKNEGQREV